jgi:glycine C-acetyltransferase
MRHGKKADSSKSEKQFVSERRSNRKRRQSERFPVKEIDGHEGAYINAAEQSIRYQITEIALDNCTLSGDVPLAAGEDVKLEIKLRENTFVLGGSVKSAVNSVHGTRRYGIRFHEKAHSLLQLLADQAPKSRRTPVDLYSLPKRFSKRLKEWKTNEYYHYHRRDSQGKELKAIDFTSNDYLALSENTRIKTSACNALTQHGLGTAGPSIFAGQESIHEQLAATLAEIKQTEACLLCPSGFTANSGIFTGLINTPGTIIFLDEKDHASIFHGAMASKGKIKVFKHNDLGHLERLLSNYEQTAAKIICVDGVYSMDGDLAPLDKIYKLAKEYNASLWLDDAHSFGIFGEKGAGIESHFGLLGKIDIVTGSLSKTLGGFGGYVCTSRAVVDFLDHLGREFVYTTTLPAAICGGLLEGLRIIRDESEDARTQLWKNSRLLKTLLADEKFPVAPTESPIIPVVFGHETITQRFAHDLSLKHINVNAVTRPAVRRNESRLRITVRSDHTEDQIRMLVRAMCEVRNELIKEGKFSHISSLAAV